MSYSFRTLMALPVSESQLREWGDKLVKPEVPLVERFRALYGLHHAKEKLSIEMIASGFKNPSALLKHELAYVLGQKQDQAALPILTALLGDEGQDVIVRHEAAEALGALASDEAISSLKKYCNCDNQDIAETCQLALNRLKYMSSPEGDVLHSATFSSIDPAPPLQDKTAEELRTILLDSARPLFERYRAMFTLRNKTTDTNDPQLRQKLILTIAEGLKCPESALFRHEIAFVLGQLSDPCSYEALRDCLANQKEAGMVRHECAEALGSIASEDCVKLLASYLEDEEILVKESCVLALDISEYQNSDQFQYAYVPNYTSP